jgi:hypothetical protein
VWYRRRLWAALRAACDGDSIGEIAGTTNEVEALARERSGNRHYWAVLLAWEEIAARRLEAGDRGGA